MIAIIISEEKEPLQLVDVAKPEIGEGECLVRIKAAALNRRDQWIREGMYPGIRFGGILGSDGFGIVEEGSEEWVGKEVIINPNVDWGNNMDAQSSSYSVLGMPTDGTLAEYIKVPIHRLNPKPNHLNDEEAAALPLAGLTAYRAALKKGKADAGKRVLITGAGGGVSQFVISFSLAIGAETYVTSGVESKIKRCVESGVTAGFNYKDEHWVKQATQVGGFDAIIDSAGGNNVNNYLKLIRPGGRIVMYGSTTGYPEKVDTFRLFWSQAQIIGSTMGNDAEFGEMISFVEKNEIKPAIDGVFSYTNFLDAFNRFKEADHFGKIVIKF